MKLLLSIVVASLPLSAMADNFYVGRTLFVTLKDNSRAQQRNRVFSSRVAALNAYWQLRSQNLRLSPVTPRTQPDYNGNGPRDFWINYQSDLNVGGNVCNDEDKAIGEHLPGAEIIHVREVLD